MKKLKNKLLKIFYSYKTVDMECSNTKCTYGALISKPIPRIPIKWLTNTNEYCEKCKSKLIPSNHNF